MAKSVAEVSWVLTDEVFIMASSRSRRWGWPLVGILYALTFAIILLAAYTNNLPAYLNRIPDYDRFGHVILYSLAAYLGHRLLHYRRWGFWGWRWSLWGWLFSLGTIAEESLQALSPNRTFSYIDMACSLAGILAGCWLADRSRPPS